MWHLDDLIKLGRLVRQNNRWKEWRDSPCMKSVSTQVDAYCSCVNHRVRLMYKEWSTLEDLIKFERLVKQNKGWQSRRGSPHLGSVSTQIEAYYSCADRRVYLIEQGVQWEVHILRSSMFKRYISPDMRFYSLQMSHEISVGSEYVVYWPA